jgi:phage shock protein C
MTWTDSRRDNGPAGNPFRLYRDVENARIAGVCAGIADYLGVRRRVVRLVAVFCLVFFLFPTVLVYVVLTLALRPKPPELFRSSEEEHFWRGVAREPVDTLQSLRRRFRDLEDRLGQMERQVASGDFDLHRKFRELDR